MTNAPTSVSVTDDAATRPTSASRQTQPAPFVQSLRGLRSSSAWHMGCTGGGAVPGVRVRGEPNVRTKVSRA